MATDKPLFSTVMFLIRVLTHFKVVNAAYIPPAGGLLMTTNHLSRLDTPFLMAITERRDLAAIIANKYQKKVFFKWLLEKISKIIWMDREKIDFAAVRESLEHMRMGGVVGIAPEGTRSRDSVGLLEGKQGAAVLAARAGVPILPVGIYGSEKVYEHWIKLRRPPITVNIGKPYILPELDMNDRQAWLARYTDEIMCRIAALLPPQYHGFYTAHPRLVELLAEAAD
jgi:1-acyl-sn-glycerol-3-phosphate acyltransferase